MKLLTKFYRRRAEMQHIILTLVLLLHGITGALDGDHLPQNGCPEKCICHHDETMDASSVSCSSTNITMLGNSLPMSTTELRFNHVNLNTFEIDLLQTVPNLKRLILRHCNLKTIIASDNQNSKSLSLPLLEVLDLSHNDILEIPKNLPTTLKTLLLSYNRISRIDAESLTGLVLLQELFIDHNELTSLQDVDFIIPDPSTESSTPSLPLLQKLALNSNNLKTIGSEAFRGLPSLNALTLAKNKLTTIARDTFGGIGYLDHLDLSKNDLSTVEDDALLSLRTLQFLDLSHNALMQLPRGMPMLAWLDLSHNNIRSIREEYRSDLYPSEVWNLAYNPFHCDCHLRWLKELYDRREHVLRHIEMDPKDFIPTCSSPDNMAGESWDNLGDEVFVCQAEDRGDNSGKPRAEESNPNTHESDLGVAIRIGVVSDSAIHVQWSYNALALQPDTSVLVQYYVFGLRGSSTKHIEVSAAQKEVILKHLKSETNYVVCLTPRRRGSGNGLGTRSLSLEDCVEISTKAPQPVPVTSYVTVIWYYILGMLATFIAIFSTIGGIAMLYGLWNNKNTQWSTSASPSQSFLDGSEADGLTYMTDVPLSARVFKKVHKD